ncbi:hypothetical protein KM908_14520 [Alkalihalobacillus clausii]|uniref:hypothetical protein n=1 Tax=Shouchella clausii TaxID=79880 RepID=UPI001652EBC3|nr:hypothetical protein [Shouchella clausii]MBU8597357.1 hypothetical protein [Shouchella clausii]
MEQRYFYCYSTNLYQHLKAAGQRFICTGLHTTTKRQFWQYVRTEALEKALDSYGGER